MTPLENHVRITKSTSIEAEVTSKELLEALGLDSTKFIIHNTSVSVSGYRDGSRVSEDSIVFFNIRNKREREA